MQVGTNYFVDGQSFQESLTDISYLSLAASGASGFLTGGVSALAKTAGSSVGKQMFIKLIDKSADVLISTVEDAGKDYDKYGEYDVWKSLTGGLLEGVLSDVLPSSIVDKLEKKLMNKMKVSAHKMEKYKKRAMDKNRSKKTRQRNKKKYQEAKKENQDATKAYIGVKTVNDAFKQGGADALQNLDMFKKDSAPSNESGKKGYISTGDLEVVDVQL